MDVETIQRRVGELVEAAEILDVAAFDSEPVEILRRDLLTPVDDLIGRACGLLGALENGGREALPTSPRRRDELADLAFIIHSQLRGQRKLPVDADQPAPYLLTAERMLNKLTRGLRALDASLADACRLSPAAPPSDQLERSLGARRVIGKFRRAIEEAEELHRDDDKAKLRTGATSFAMLVCKPEFRHLRVADRLTANQLHARIRDWASEGSPEGARVLWQDLATYASLLWDVNRRSELVEHDREAMGELIVILAEMQPHAALPVSTMTALHALQGYDLELDARVRAGQDVNTVLTRLLELNRGSVVG